MELSFFFERESYQTILGLLGRVETQKAMRETILGEGFTETFPTPRRI